MYMDKRTNEQMNESISRLTSQRKKEAKKKGITNKLKKKVDNEERGLLGTRSSLSLYMCVLIFLQLFTPSSSSSFFLLLMGG